MIRRLAVAVALWAVCGVLAHAISFERLTRLYPSWQYVLWELDLDVSYIQSAGFLSFAGKNRRKLEALYRNVMQNKGYLVRLIRSELLQHDMSDLFVYMSIVESALRCNAVSPKRAVGIWQFMPRTAKRYHLTCNSFIDERRDPVASTKAAIAYLQALHDRFGKWYLAVMAYNCGEGCVQRALKRAQSDDPVVLSETFRHYLPEETVTYLRRIVLLAMIAENDSVRIETPYNLQHSETTWTLYRLKQGESIDDVASRFGISKAALLRYNEAFYNDGGSHTMVLVPLR